MTDQEKIQMIEFLHDCPDCEGRLEYDGGMGKNWASDYRADYWVCPFCGAEFTVSTWETGEKTVETRR